MRSRSRFCRITLAAAGCATGVVSLTSSALACGALPSGLYAFIAPAQASEPQATDAPVVLPLRCTVESDFSEVVRNAACAYTSYTASRVTLKPVDGGAEVTGRVVPTPGALFFLPSAPLASNTAYNVEAQLQNGDSDLQTTRTVIRTTNAPLAAFESAQPLGVTPEWYDAPVAQCDGARLVGAAAAEVLTGPFPICPTYANCVAAGTERTLRLHAKLGPFRGGASAHPYAAQLNVASGVAAPFEVRGFAPADLTATDGGAALAASYAESVNGGSVDLYLALTAPADLKTLLCARARAFDVTGKLVELPARCRTYVQWMTDAEWPDAAGDDDHGGTSEDGLGAAPSPTRGNKGDDGCSALPGRGAASSGVLAMLALCVVTLRRRRARGLSFAGSSPTTTT